MKEVDAELAAMQKYAPQESPSRKVAAPKSAPADAEIAAINEVLAREKKEAADRAAGRSKPAADAAPMQVEPRRRRSEAYVDQTSWAKKLIKPGWVGRWVRTLDREGNKDSAQRTDQFYQDGYDIVRDQEGQPVKNSLGILMQAPPDAYVDRVRLYEKSYVKNPDSLLEGSREAVREINRAAGEHVATLEIGKEHGSKTVTEEFAL